MTQQWIRRAGIVAVVVATVITGAHSTATEAGAPVRQTWQPARHIVLEDTLPQPIKWPLKRLSPSTPVPPRNPTATPAAHKPRYVVVLVLDGARPDYFQVPGIPHVRALMHRGTVYTNAFDGILQSETPAGHAAIGSGSFPRRNGIPSFGWESGSNWVSIFNPTAALNGTIGGLMSNAPSLAGLLHRHDKKAVVAAVGTYKYYAVAPLGGPDANIITFYETRKDGRWAQVSLPGHVAPPALVNRPDLIRPSSHLQSGTSDHLAMQSVKDTFETTHAQVIMTNLPEFDWPLGHIYGANRDHKGVVALMRGFDRDLASLEDAYRKAGVLNQTLFVVTADHGFEAFDRTVQGSVIENAVSSAGLQVTHADLHTAAYLWVNDPTRSNVAAEAIAQLMNPGIQSVYFKEHTASGYDYIRATGAQLFDVPGMEAANESLLQSFASSISPDVVVMFREGTVGFSPGETWKGDHGGADWESQHIPLILAGAGVHSGKVSSYPARLIDIAPTILTLLGASYTGMDGRPLADAMLRPPAGALAAQRTRQAQLLPLVAAMQQEAILERRADR